MIEPEFEVGHVEQPISLAFEGLDFVINSLYQATGNAVQEVAQHSITVGHEGLGDFLQLPDAGIGFVCAPSLQELEPFDRGGLLPKRLELFLHAVDGEKGDIGLQKNAQPALLVFLELLVV